MARDVTGHLRNLGYRLVSGFSAVEWQEGSWNSAWLLIDKWENPVGSRSWLLFLQQGCAEEETGLQQSQGIKSGLALGMRAHGTFPGVKRIDRLWEWTCCLCDCSGASEDPKCLVTLQEFICSDKAISSAFIFSICFSGGVLLLSNVLEQRKKSSSKESSCSLHSELRLGISLEGSLLCPTWLQYTWNNSLVPGTLLRWRVHFDLLIYPVCFVLVFCWWWFNAMVWLRVLLWSSGTLWKWSVSSGPSNDLLIVVCNIYSVTYSLMF